MTGRGEVSRIQLWVAKETGLPVRYEDDFANGTVKQKVSWEIEYDPTLSVQPPVQP